MKKMHKAKQIRLSELAKPLSLILPIVIMLAIFMVRGIYPFGGRGFLFSDMYHQYMPFFQEFLRSIKAGEGISFTWNVGIGSNFLALYIYYLASPLHWLAFLVPERFLMEFMSYLVILKIGFCGLTSYLYLNKRNPKKEGFALFISLFYAMSGFIAAYNWNIMWLDCVVLLPVIVMGLEKLITEGKSGLYCVSLALCILTNYYISIMVCFFLVFYFVYLFFTEKMRFSSIFRFALYSLLAGGMAAVLVIPEVCAILSTDFGAISFPKKVETYFSVLDMLARHCMSISPERGLDHWPNIYCGVAAFFLIPLYAVNEKIPAKKRFGMLALAGVFLLGFSVNVLNFIWHGLNYPDSLPARQSFIYIFLVLIMCHDSLSHLDGQKPGNLARAYLAAVTFLLFTQKFVDNEDFWEGVIYLNLVFVTIYAVLLYLYHTKKGFVTKVILLVLALAAIITESSWNMMDTSVGTIDRTAYVKNIPDYRELYQEALKQEEGFFRMEKFERKTKNDGTLVGIPTASVFSSTLNSQVMRLFQKLGMRYSKVYYGYDGATAFTGALFNVKYMLSEKAGFENELYELWETKNDVLGYRALYTLPFGYVAPVGYDLPETSGKNVLELQNEMVNLLGINGLLFSRNSSSDTEEQVELEARRSGIHYGILKSSGTKKLIATGGNPSEMKFNDLKSGELIYLGHLNQGDIITLKNDDKNDDTPEFRMEFYTLNQEVLKEALAVLAEQHMEQVTYTNDTISGLVKLEKPGRVILSVPAEKGWKVRINGEKAEFSTFGEALIALDMEAGTYEVEMKYIPEGKWLGLWVSLGSIVLFAVCMLARKKYFRNRKKRIDIPT